MSRLKPLAICLEINIQKILQDVSPFTASTCDRATTHAARFARLTVDMPQYMRIFKTVFRMVLLGDTK